ncbi:hypothetical protein IQ269_08375 [Tychonema sp. LEGE 07199]|uniref:hypothetical protein n=1 Tax=unclassified Tychonema TaxID=2642144 RepID=UPI00188012A1|nr:MULTISPECIES: hypothetical protein [unclassified Tychonema]MBE9120833.1 hypothetical protein [Tychonema sp. LEGE 07199]MBE9133147.1 hypothetical protein [Tychonema sp. LEGE 07196]
MNDEQEKNQILTQQPETVSTASDEFPNAEMVSANSTAEPTETPAEIVANEDIPTTINELETIPISAEYPPETSQLVSDSYPTTYTASSEPKPAQKWQIWAIFLSGILVGSVLSLGSLLAWRMYQERANIQIRLPADVPLQESPPPVPAARLNRRPGLPPAPQQTLPLTIPPSASQTPIPSLSGVPPLASPLPNSSPSPSPAAVETPVTERVNFQAGATGVTLRNSLRANISKRYLLDCNSGQTMTVKVQEGDVSAAIIAPNGEKLGTADSTGEWQGQLATSGDYTIEISGDRQANYGVKIEVN